MSLLGRRGVSFKTILHCSRTQSSLPPRHVNGRTHYDTLGVARTANKSDIRAAFIALSKKHHPDVSKARNANKQFTEINEAYGILISPSKRYQYDMTLHYASQEQSRAQSLYEYTRNYEYHNLSEEEWNRLYQQSLRTPNHSRVIKWLIVMMVVATTVHTFRIGSAHKQFQAQHERETRKNSEIYENIRETAKSSTLEEQLKKLSEAHSKALGR